MIIPACSCRVGGCSQASCPPSPSLAWLQPPPFSSRTSSTGAACPTSISPNLLALVSGSPRTAQLGALTACGYGVSAQSDGGRRISSAVINKRRP
jgi:hypothetical protein